MQEELIKFLSDGAFHTGDDLGKKLSISRAGIWKKIKKLKDIGLDVQSVKGKGYRLSSPLELLNSSTIQLLLSDEVLPFLTELDVYSCLPSTNDVAMKKAQLGVAGYACLSEQQTRGRGRRGRAWISPFGSNLYLSVVWQFHQGASQLEGLSLATGVAVVKALTALGVEKVGLKWPNDILVNEAKLGGVLLEMTGDPAGRCQVVLGIGVNHKLPTRAGADIDQDWVRLEDISPGISRNYLAAEVLSEVLLMLNEFQAYGFACFQRHWQSLDLYFKKEVIVSTGSETPISGVALGVDESGGLKLQTPYGIKIMKGGEVSLRRAL